MTAKEVIVIDAEGCTMGRLAAFAAKEALNKKQVIIFNAEKAIMSGKTDDIFADMKKRYQAKSGTNPWRYGPKRPKNPDRYIRRVVRGMLPWTKTMGREAFKRVMVYMGKPEMEIMKQHGVDLAKVSLYDNKVFKKHYDYFITVGDLCSYLGGRIE
jgi:large subunit ribosomal protein L13